MNSEITVKLDTSSVTEAIQKYLEPGCVLMSKQSVAELYRRLGEVRSLAAMYRLLTDCGAEVALHDELLDD